MRRYILLICFVCLMASGVVYADKQSEHRGGEGRKNRMEMFLEKEKLTPQERAQVSSYRDAYRKKMEGLRAQLKSCREQLRVELEKSAPDRNVINKIALEMKQAQAAMLDARIEGILSMKAMIQDIRKNNALEKK